MYRSPRGSFGKEADAVSAVTAYAAQAAHFILPVIALIVLLRCIASKFYGRAEPETWGHLVTPDGKEIVARGECPGHIQFERHGSGGIGYDPVFFAEDAGCTFAELAPEQKNQVSHRARALRAFVEKAFGTKKEKELC